MSPPFGKLPHCYSMLRLQEEEDLGFRVQLFIVLGFRVLGFGGLVFRVSGFQSEEQ